MAPAVSKQPASAASQQAAPAPGKPAATASSPFTAKVAAANTAAPKTKNKKKTTAVSVKKPAPAKSTVAVEDKKNPDPKKDEHKTISMAGGRRDPFISPVVNRSMGGSGCSTGKRCLAVDQIALQGIVKSDAGMIAVVVNAMNKAYFLRENDPVFNGYVVKITGDSIVFKETLQDKLGKSFTREVTKKISTPAV
jgi:Tfp pilus assembly protein PilP